MFKKTDSSQKYILPLAITLLLIVAGARASAYLYTLSSTDITYPDWVVVFSSYLTDALGAVRLAVSFSAVTFAYYYKKKVFPAACVTVLCSLADFAARFIIDIVTDAIIGNEIIAVIWLLLSFLYEFVFIILACVIARIMILKLARCDTDRKLRKYTAERALIYSVILYMISRVISELFYMVDFLISYVNITNTEIASIVGSFLRIFVIYGGISLITGYLSLSVLTSRSRKAAASD